MVGVIHQDILSSTIVGVCTQYGIACRHGTFLCSDMLKQEFSLDSKRQQQQERSSTSENICAETEDGLVRISLAHYNTVHEIEYTMEKLESIPN